MSEIYKPKPHIIEKSQLDKAAYEAMYQQSISNPDTFWAEQAHRFVDWFEPWDRVQDNDYTQGRISWFRGAKLNVAHNCLDRHLAERGDKAAIIWEPDEPGQHRTISYRELHQQVCRFGNVLKEHGVTKGDVVCLYMPMVPEAAVAMLACARIGAVHSVVFGGFSAEALRDRINDAECKLLITADHGTRGGKRIPLKENADTACTDTPSINKIIVVKCSGETIPWHSDRNIWYHEAIANVSSECPATPMDAEDPLFILYTSGSTGKPKGILHTTGGYLLYAAMTHQYVFDYREDDIYWCTADIGWVTGHSYVVYGPLANGATTLMFEGIPTYPDASRCWQIIDKHGVNIFYTAPTMIRTLMGQGDQYVTNTSRQSLRVLGTVGEPINPEAWRWYHNIVGNGDCALVDTWWQTETGGTMITPLPGATDTKPGSATLPFFGIVPALLDDKGNLLTDTATGNLVLTCSWPGQMRGIYGDPERFFNTYFKVYPGYYFTGDGAHRDADGYWWITGRVDDVINVSGHRMGTAEIESAFVLHPAVAESAVVARPHPIKGESIYAYVTLIVGVESNDQLQDDLIQHVRSKIGAIASPDAVQFTHSLPKTRSGKIMRRILRKIAEGDVDNLGDVSTLTDPSIVVDLIRQRIA